MLVVGVEAEAVVVAMTEPVEGEVGTEEAVQGCTPIAKGHWSKA